MKTKITLLACSLLCIVYLTLAQPGTLDNTFGTGGKVITQVNSTLLPGWAYATAIQSDGKIVVVGQFYNSSISYTDFFVLRYNSNGTLDNTFGNNGKVDLDLGHESIPTCVAIQKDGKIVVAGLNGDDNIAIVRLNTNGSPDYTFGFLGEVITDLGGTNDLVYSVAMQNDGKIVIAGTTNNNGNDRFFVVRYYGNGALDNTFNGNGKVFTLIGTHLCRARSVAIQTDGKIVVAGFYKTGTVQGYNFAVARYNTNGTLDNAFGNNNGKVGIDFNLGDDYGNSVALQQDGKIIVAGETFKNGITEFAVTKLGLLGNRVSNFGVSGKVTTLIGNGGLGSSLAIQTNGKIVAAGRVFGSLNTDFGLVRYNVNGSLDNSFGTNGIVTTDFGYNDYGESVAIQQDGKIVVVGTTVVVEGGIGGDKIAIARYIGDPPSLTATAENISAASDKKLSYSSTIKMFPNPAKDLLNIEGMDASSTKTISIVDMNGRVLQTTTTGNSTHTWNIASLPAGTYYLLIDDGKKKTSLKFIKE